MKKFFKLIFASITSFLFIFTLAACNQVPTESSSSASANSTTSTTQVTPTPTTGTSVVTTTPTTTPVKSDAEIKENFNKEISKVSLSKASINSYIKSALSQASDVDFDKLISEVNLPATKVSVNSTKEDNSITTQTYYQWQDGTKIYFGSNNNDAVESYYLDLAAITELLPQSPDQTEEVDYVALILSSLNITDPNFDIDTYLGYINFNVDDFSYVNGVFTFNKISLINYLVKVLEIKDEETLTIISTYVNLFLTKFEINIKYDGEKFTEFNVEIEINVKNIALLLATEQDAIEISDDSYVSLSFNLTLNYLKNIFTSAQIDFSVVADVNNHTTDDIALDASFEFSCNITPLLVESSLSLDLDYSAKITNESFDEISGTTETEEYVQSLTVNFTNTNKLDVLKKEFTNELSLTAKTALDSKVVFDLSVNASLTLAPSQLKLDVKLNKTSFIEAEINFANNYVTDGKVTVYPKVLVEAVGSGSSITTDYVKGEVVIETKDVVVPDALLNNDSAVDILSLLNPGTADTPTPYNN